MLLSRALHWVCLPSLLTLVSGFALSHPTRLPVDPRLVPLARALLRPSLIVRLVAALSLPSALAPCPTTPSQLLSSLSQPAPPTVRLAITAPRASPPSSASNPRSTLHQSLAPVCAELGRQTQIYSPCATRRPPALWSEKPPPSPH
ncbi:hypothetical protein DMC30DRAFT_9893 [Rhodotorula diobovata]|uniref:Secreted protein n=1 Tax=Rhodotorula diobovata TaxID=5288 RepID=A0A5C5G373_9BASI|nr:hypothetical protein DMC30DRAFT_9893 [Rhodotorula diobovata]